MWWRRSKKPEERISPAVLDAAFRIKLREHVPVREPLSRQHPELSDAELDECVAIIESTYRWLGELFDSLPRASGEIAPDGDVFRRSARGVPWLSEGNASGYYSQCVWSLMK